MKTKAKAVNNSSLPSNIFVLGDSVTKISGTAGNDTISGTAGNDVIAGNAGNDVIAGNAGDDFLLGNRGEDFLLGNRGNDVVHGGEQNDIVYGGFGDDMVYGDEGDDFVSGDEDNDVLFGGTGSDTFYFGGTKASTALSAGNDVIRDFTFDGATMGDKIQIVGLGSAFDSYSEFISGAQQTADGVLFDFGGNRSLLVEGVTIDELTSDYFIF